MRRLVVTALALCGLATAAAAQPPQGAPPGSGPPAQEQKPKNLKVLPADLPMRAVRDTMSSFARALGVRCTHCHVGTDGQPQTMDFAADDKPEKEKAREMMRMATAINATTWRSSPRVARHASSSAARPVTADWPSRVRCSRWCSPRTSRAAPTRPRPATARCGSSTTGARHTTSATRRWPTWRRRCARATGWPTRCGCTG
jgi:hypothetical protein